MEWGANRALLDTLYDEAAGDFLNARGVVQSLRVDLDSCRVRTNRSNERFDQAHHELSIAQDERDFAESKSKRKGKTATIAIAVAVAEGAWIVGTNIKRP